MFQKSLLYNFYMKSYESTQRYIDHENGIIRRTNQAMYLPVAWSDNANREFSLVFLTTLLHVLGIYSPMLVMFSSWQFVKFLFDESILET